MSAESTRAAYWPVQVLRAIPALVVGLAITFSPDHTAFFGFIVFGSLALVTGAVLVWGSRRIRYRALRTIALVEGLLAAACGVAALALSTTSAGTFFLTVTIFAATTGFLELYLGLRSRGKHPASRDWLTVGVLTALLAIAVLLVPANYALPVAEGGVLTSQIVVVGIVGAYAILVGVYLVIAGLSGRWSTQEIGAAVPQTGRE